jgi:hypothetical protein
MLCAVVGILGKKGSSAGIEPMLKLRVSTQNGPIELAVSSEHGVKLERKMHS